MLEKTLESPLDSKEIKAVNPKGNQPWIFIGRTVAEAAAPILWPPNAKSQLFGKDPDAGKIKGKRRSEWQRMRWLDGINDSMDMSEQTQGDNERQGSLECYSSWGCKELDMTSWLNKINKQMRSVLLLSPFCRWRHNPCCKGTSSPVGRQRREQKSSEPN